MNRDTGPGSPPPPPPARRHWSDSPEAIRHLAAAHALGTLSGPARRRFEAVLATHPAAARAVGDWHRRLAPLAERLAPLPPSPTLWARIEERAWAGAAASPVGSPAGSPAESPALMPTLMPASSPASPAESPRPGPAHPPHRAPRAAPPPAPLAAWRRWLASLLSPAPAMAIAFSFVMGWMAPTLGVWIRGGSELAAADGATELPESYVGVLATAQGRTGLIVSSLRQGRVLDVKRVVAVPVAPNQQQVLWIIDAQGRSVAVAAVPVGPFVRVPLPQAADPLFATAVELAVSLEPAGALPAQPGAPFVYRGLCGKLWRVPAPPR